MEFEKCTYIDGFLKLGHKLDFALCVITLITLKFMPNMILVFTSRAPISVLNFRQSKAHIRKS